MQRPPPAIDIPSSAESEKLLETSPQEFFIVLATTFRELESLAVICAVYYVQFMAMNTA